MRIERVIFGVTTAIQLALLALMVETVRTESVTGYYATAAVAITIGALLAAVNVATCVMSYQNRHVRSGIVGLNAIVIIGAWMMCIAAYLGR